MNTHGLLQKTSDQRSVIDLVPGRRDFWWDYVEKSKAPSVNVGSLVTIPAALDAPLFYQAYQHALRAHDALGMVLERDQAGHKLVQVPREAVPIMQWVDCGETADPYAAAFRDACRLADAPLSLFSGPLYRARIYTLGPDTTAWAFVCHHMVCDGWSMAMFVNDVLATYRGLLDCKVVLPERPSFVDWARKGEFRVPKPADAYWRERLPAEVNPLFDTPVQGQPGGRGLFESTWSPERQDRLQGFVETDQSQAVRVVQAVLGAALTHLTGKRDWLMGVPSSNRRNRKQKNMSGQFASCGVFPWGYAETNSLKSLLAAMRRDQMGDYRAGVCPTSDIAEKLGEAGASGPLFDVSFNALQLGDFDFHFDGKKAKVAYVPFQNFAHALEVVFTETAQGGDRAFVYNYDPRVLSEEAVRLIDCVVNTLLDRAPREPDRPLDQLAADLPILAPLCEQRVAPVASPSVHADPCQTRKQTAGGQIQARHAG
ncbi:condensation domain-containing protein [Acanthopleuribacter pedis]|uniref:Condensation domain-containing protein n=1 Tax=Acanthopleuribacter pedis TaxID=442870 RepID=A0A8J7U4P8_9BACT|nr:condensation domain-containing protein [Acanthopleuribacter pedis]MBO1320867.1 hypothetical protein [Acanthopleuribacter pedis]